MTEPVRVYIGIGSGIDRERHITAALDTLAAWFAPLALSPVYESEPVGFRGELFLNLVVGVETDLSVAALSRRLKQLEDRQGRRRDLPKCSARTLDLDILTYGDQVGHIDGVELPRSEILTNAFVLQPLADLAPAERHPVRGLTYRQLWLDYRGDQKLWPVAFSWHGRGISRPDPACL